MDQIVVRSPNNQFQAVFQYISEIRFGPAYYSLELNSLYFENRVFGNKYLWSPDSRFFAVQEWLTTDEANGPETQLLLIDIGKEKECVLSKARQGFIRPMQFEYGKIIYAKEYPSSGNTSEFEIEFLTLDRWKSIK